MNVIVNTTRITVRPENRNELFQTIRPLLEPIRSERGCVTYHFYVDADDENLSVLIGEWETAEDWHNHLRSRVFAVLLGAITVLSSPSSIDFKLLTSFAESEGLNRNHLSRLNITGEPVCDEPGFPDPIGLSKKWRN